MSPITEEFRKMFVHEKLRISMSELSQAANVSPSQIRLLGAQRLYCFRAGSAK